MAKFTKGQSGNPSGRPKALINIRDEARNHAITALQTLVEMLNSPDAPHASRVSAAKEILDRGFGKAPQPHDGDGEGGAIKLIQTIERVIVRKKG